jgi:hypothetical protein
LTDFCEDESVYQQNGMPIYVNQAHVIQMSYNLSHINSTFWLEAIVDVERNIFWSTPSKLSSLQPILYKYGRKKSRVLNKYLRK